ncbi:UDP-glycosyltransferase 91A1-like [Mercurialis annua]|uniref:UDP-glycosyltransferase 91A1-like n=1 Tax=Mercurialis annua TaxID=3986 RepID=UPI0021601C63|nr:UDP-glycosyltransferase 91A1-like [Mercurialis annua]
MARNEENDHKLHIAMFPWLAFGHMIPFLELSIVIAQKGHKISFISTPKNIDRLPKIPQNLAHLINFIKLPLPYVQNLPLHAESTTDLPLEDTWHLTKAYDLLQEPFSQFLQSNIDNNSLPNWILFDFVSFWVPDLCRKLNVRTVFFSIFTASSLCYCCPPSGDEDYRSVIEDYTVKPVWIPFQSAISFNFFEAVRVFSSITGNESNLSVFYRLREAIKRCDLIAVRSCTEFESEWLQLMKNLHKKPVIPVGLLPRKADEAESDSWRSIKNWLDNQRKGSVVYVAFGSEAKPSQVELTELALGLELSRLPFLWVLRKRRGLADTEAVELPDNGFEERVKGLGMVCTSWAPQVRILAHDSVGGFLTHSGMGSVVEGLQFGRALIVLTYFSDQGLNARVLEEKKIAHLIPRNEEDGSFTSQAVADSLRLVVEEEEGKVYRDNCMEMKELFGDRNRQNQYVDKFVDCLRNPN